jgi:thymidylate synthase (FAD)
MSSDKKGLGFVELVDQMGDAISIVNAARVSFGKRHEGKLRDKDKRLIEYLWSHKHTSPFRHVQFTFHIKAPIFVIRQWQKHQVGCAWNEMSGRYVEFANEIYKPQTWRESIKDVKQGSGFSLVDQETPSLIYEEACKSAFEAYQALIEAGVCREQARIILPLSMFTECFWSCSFQALIHFLKLRLAKDAQVETQLYAQALFEILNRDEDMKFLLEVCL